MTTLKINMVTTLRLLFTDTDNLMYEIKTMFMKILVRIKKCLILVITHLNQKNKMIRTN